MRNILLLIAILSTQMLFGQDNNPFKLDSEFNIVKGNTLSVNTNDADFNIIQSKSEKGRIKVFRDVDIVGISSEEEFNIEIEEDRGNIYINEKRKRDNNYSIGYRSMEYKIDLEIPKGVKLYLSEDDGDIIIKGLDADVQLNMEDGDINITDFTGSELTIKSEDGDIKLNNCSGKAMFEMEDGDLEAVKCNFTSVIIEMEDGDIELETNLFDNGQYNLESEDGDILFKMSGNGALINLKTDDGDIKSSGNFNSISKDKDKQSFEFGNKGAKVNIETEDGSIELRLM